MPHSYYAQLQARTGNIDEPVHELEKLGILVDRDDEGYMLQIFTRPVDYRPTLFLLRSSSAGAAAVSGKETFKALFRGHRGANRLSAATFEHAGVRSR